MGDEYVLAAIWPAEESTSGQLASLGKLLSDWHSCHETTVSRIDGLAELLAGVRQWSTYVIWLQFLRHQIGDAERGRGKAVLAGPGVRGHQGFINRDAVSEGSSGGF